jgi:hypothetical protein
MFIHHELMFHPHIVQATKVKKVIMSIVRIGVNDHLSLSVPNVMVQSVLTISPGAYFTYLLAPQRATQLINESID